MTRPAAATIATFALILAGCRDDAPKPVSALATPPPAAAPQAAQGSMPPGHPPIAEAASGMPPHGGGGAAVPVQAAVTWDVPSTWKSEPPTSSMRRAQYKVPGPGGEGECVVFYFGPGEGGDPQSNAERWADQFTTADGKPARPTLKTSKLEGGKFPVTLVEVKGTYVGGMGSGPGVAAPGSLAGSALLGAILEGPDAAWFFKLVGPEATVTTAREPFLAMLRSARKGQ